MNFTLILILLSIIQVSYPEYLKISGSEPDLLLAAIILISMFRGKRTLILALFSGILKDSLALNTFGINTITFVLWSFLTVILSKKLTLDTIFAYTALVLTVAFLDNIIRMLLFLLSGALFVPFGIFFKVIILGSFYTAMITPLLWEILKEPLAKVKTRDYLKTIALAEK